MSLANLISNLLGRTSAPAIEHDQLQEACLAGDCHLVDVREPHEYDAGHIPGATNQPLSTFDPAKLPTGKPVVLVCQAGSRSARALQAALAHGHKEIAHYPHGTAGWRSRGGAIATK